MQLELNRDILLWKLLNAAELSLESSSGRPMCASIFFGPISYNINTNLRYMLDSPTYYFKLLAPDHDDRMVRTLSTCILRALLCYSKVRSKVE